VIRVVVDANVLISALLNGSAKFVLFDSKFEFVTTEFTLREVYHFLPFISARSSVPLNELEAAIRLFPLVVYPRQHYRHMLSRARKVLRNIDLNDVDLLALYFTESTYLWSEDKDFEEIRPPIRLLKTKDFF